MRVEKNTRSFTLLFLAIVLVDCEESLESETTTTTAGEVATVTDVEQAEPAADPKATVNPFVDKIPWQADEFLYPVTRDASRNPLYLMGFGAINIVAGWSSAGIIPSILMAIDDVNAREDVLPGYQLIVDMKDSTCDAGKATEQLFEHLSTPPTKIMILGGGCSVATVPVARSASLYGLNQMAYSAASPELSRRDFYPSFFRTAMSDFAMNPPIIALCQKYNWSHVATIHESDPLFSTTINQIHRYFDDSNITLVTAESFSTNPEVPLKNIKRKNARIIFFDAYEPAAAKSFCEIYKLGLYGPRYQWIIPGWWNEFWWTLYAQDTDCTEAEIVTALNYSITVTDLKGDLSGEKTISGKNHDPLKERVVTNIPKLKMIGFQKATYEEYVDEYLHHSSYEVYGFNAYHSFGYDAVWAASLALNKTAQTLQQQDYIKSLPNGTIVRRPKRLEDFEYGVDLETSAELFKNLAEVSFHGVSGPVSFKDGERSGVSDVRQMRGADHVRFAVFDDTVKQLQWLDEIAWHSGKPPIAWPRTLVLVKYKDYNLVVSASILALVGCCLAGGVLIFNGINNDHMHIKMSSPKLNNTIVVGSIMAYTAVALFGLDTNFVSASSMLGLCTCRVWVLCCSFTLSFGAMFAKTWRVHRIFTKLAIVNEPVHDRHLLGFVGVLLLIDVGILVPWVIIDPLQLTYQNSSIVESDDTIRVYQNEKCTCKWIWYWMAAIYLVKGLLLVFGCFLAYETRKVSIPGLNDSKFIGVCVYNVVVMCLVGVTISLVLTEKETIAYSFQAFCVLFCTTTTLCVLFIPKAIFVRKHPEQSSSARKNTGKKCASDNSSVSSTFQYSMRSASKSTDSINTISIDGRAIGPDLSGVLSQREKDITDLKARLRGMEKACELETAKAERKGRFEATVGKQLWDDAVGLLKAMAQGINFIQYISNLTPDAEAEEDANKNIGEKTQSSA